MTQASEHVRSPAATLDLMVAGQAFRLLADRAVLWRERATLILSDTHFGKAASFRALGVPAPEPVTERDLARIDRLLEFTRATRVMHLGDLAHDYTGMNATVEASLRAWRDRHPHLDITLVRGNHDRKVDAVCDRLGIRLVQPPLIDECGVQFCHAPEEIDAHGPTLAMHGHLHPCVVLKRAKESLRARCFVIGGDRRGGADDGAIEGAGPVRMVLPAFGSFTGCRAAPRAPGDRVVVTSDSELVPVGDGA